MVNYDRPNIDVVTVTLPPLEKEKIRECFSKLSKRVIWDTKYSRLVKIMLVVHSDIMRCVQDSFIISSCGFIQDFVFSHEYSKTELSFAQFSQ